MRQNIKIKNWKKIVGAIVAAAFLFTNTSLGLAAQDKGIVVSKKTQAESTPYKANDLKDITISSDSGKIIETWFSQDSQNNKPKTVIHIQDLHCNYEAQKKLASIVDELIKKHQVKLILVEGGVGDVSLSYLRKYADNKKRLQVAENFLKEGKISGEEYLDIISDLPMQLYGIEDPKLYTANLQVYRDVQKIKDNLLKELQPVKTAAENLKTSIYSKQLMEFESNKKAYEKENIKLTVYCQKLIDSAKEKSIDLSRFKNISVIGSLSEAEKNFDARSIEAERDKLIERLSRELPKPQLKSLVDRSALLKAQKITQLEYYNYLARLSGDRKAYPKLNSYIEYLKAQEKISVTGLFDEIRLLQDKIKENLFENEDQRKLNQISETLAALEKLISLKLAPNDYEFYSKNKKDFYSSNYLPFIKEKLAQYKKTTNMPQDLADLDQSLEKLESFYEIAKKRDEAFLKNTMDAMVGEEIAVLIAGGFHTERLGRLFKNNGISYVVIAPKSTQETDEAIYHRMLTEYEPTFAESSNLRMESIDLNDPRAKDLEKGLGLKDDDFGAKHIGRRHKALMRLLKREAVKKGTNEEDLIEGWLKQGGVLVDDKSLIEQTKKALENLIDICLRMAAECRSKKEEERAKILENVAEKASAILAENAINSADSKNGMFIVNVPDEIRLSGKQSKNWVFGLVTKKGRILIPRQIAAGLNRDLLTGYLLHEIIECNQIGHNFAPIAHINAELQEKKIVGKNLDEELEKIAKEIAEEVVTGRAAAKAAVITEPDVDDIKRLLKAKEIEEVDINKISKDTVKGLTELEPGQILRAGSTYITVLKDQGKFYIVKVIKKEGKLDFDNDNRIELTAASKVLGRLDIQKDDALISRKQFVARVDDDKVYIVDAGSKNKTFLLKVVELEEEPGLLEQSIIADAIKAVGTSDFDLNLVRDEKYEIDLNDGLVVIFVASVKFFIYKGQDGRCYILVTDKDGKECGKAVLAEGAGVKIGRDDSETLYIGDYKFKSPEARIISKEHLALAVEKDKLFVKCHPSSRNDTNLAQVTEENEVIGPQRISGETIIVREKPAEKPAEKKMPLELWASAHRKKTGENIPVGKAGNKMVTKEEWERIVQKYREIKAAQAAEEAKKKAQAAEQERRKAQAAEEAQKAARVSALVKEGSKIAEKIYAAKNQRQLSDLVKDWERFISENKDEGIKTYVDTVNKKIEQLKASLPEEERTTVKRASGPVEGTKMFKPTPELVAMLKRHSKFYAKEIPPIAEASLDCADLDAKAVVIKLGKGIDILLHIIKEQDKYAIYATDLEGEIIHARLSLKEGKMINVCNKNDSIWLNEFELENIKGAKEVSENHAVITLKGNELILQSPDKKKIFAQKIEKSQPPAVEQIREKINIDRIAKSVEKWLIDINKNPEAYRKQGRNEIAADPDVIALKEARRQIKYYEFLDPELAEAIELLYLDIVAGLDIEYAVEMVARTPIENTIDVENDLFGIRGEARRVLDEAKPDYKAGTRLLDKANGLMWAAGDLIDIHCRRKAIDHMIALAPADNKEDCLRMLEAQGFSQKQRAIFVHKIVELYCQTRASLKAGERSVEDAWSKILNRYKTQILNIYIGMLKEPEKSIYVSMVEELPEGIPTLEDIVNRISTWVNGSFSEIEGQVFSSQTLDLDLFLIKRSLQGKDPLEKLKDDRKNELNENIQKLQEALNSEAQKVVKTPGSIKSATDLIETLKRLVEKVGKVSEERFKFAKPNIISLSIIKKGDSTIISGEYDLTVTQADIKAGKTLTPNEILIEINSAEKGGYRTPLPARTPIEGNPWGKHTFSIALGRKLEGDYKVRISSAGKGIGLYIGTPVWSNEEETTARKEEDSFEVRTRKIATPSITLSKLRSNIEAALTYDKKDYEAVAEIRKLLKEAKGKEAPEKETLIGRANELLRNIRNEEIRKEILAGVGGQEINAEQSLEKLVKNTEESLRDRVNLESALEFLELVKNRPVVEVSEIQDAINDAVERIGRLKDKKLAEKIKDIGKELPPAKPEALAPAPAKPAPVPAKPVLAKPAEEYDIVEKLINKELGQFSKGKESLVGKIPGLTENMEKAFESGQVNINKWPDQDNAEGYRIISTIGGGTLQPVGWSVIGYSDRPSLKEQRVAWQAYKTWKEIRVEIGTPGDINAAIERFRKEITEKYNIEILNAADSGNVYMMLYLLNSLPINLLKNPHFRKINFSADRDADSRFAQYNKNKKEVGIISNPVNFSRSVKIAFLLHELGHASLRLLSKEDLKKLAEIQLPEGAAYCTNFCGENPEARIKYVYGDSGEFFAENFMYYILIGEKMKNGFADVFRDDQASINAWKAIYEFYRKYVFGGREYLVERDHFVYKDSAIDLKMSIKEPLPSPAPAKPVVAPLPAPKPISVPAKPRVYECASEELNFPGINPSKRVIAIGDQHANLEGLQKAMNAARSNGDLCVLLGDAVDRGPNSRGTDAFIRDNQKKGANIVRLLGNHELMYVGKNAFKKEVEKLSENKNNVDPELLEDDNFIERLREDILSGRIKAAYEEDGVIFVHGVITKQLIASAKDLQGLSAKQFVDRVNNILVEAVKSGNFSHPIFGLTGNPGIFAAYFTRVSEENIADYTQVNGHDPSYFATVHGTAGHKKIGIKQRQDGKGAAMCIDTAMTPLYKDGEPTAVVFEQGKVKVLYANRPAPAPAPTPAPAKAPTPAPAKPAPTPQKPAVPEPTPAEKEAQIIKARLNEIQAKKATLTGDIENESKKLEEINKEEKELKEKIEEFKKQIAAAKTVKPASHPREETVIYIKSIVKEAKKTVDGSKDFCVRNIKDMHGVGAVAKDIETSLNAMREAAGDSPSDTSLRSLCKILKDFNLRASIFANLPEPYKSECGSAISGARGNIGRLVAWFKDRELWNKLSNSKEYIIFDMKLENMSASGLDKAIDLMISPSDSTIKQLQDTAKNEADIRTKENDRDDLFSKLLKQMDAKNKLQGLIGNLKGQLAALEKEESELTQPKGLEVSQSKAPAKPSPEQKPASAPAEKVATVSGLAESEVAQKVKEALQGLVNLYLKSGKAISEEQWGDFKKYISDNKDDPAMTAVVKEIAGLKEKIKSLNPDDREEIQKSISNLLKVLAASKNKDVADLAIKVSEAKKNNGNNNGPEARHGYGGNTADLMIEEAKGMLNAGKIEEARNHIVAALAWFANNETDPNVSGKEDLDVLYNTGTARLVLKQINNIYLGENALVKDLSDILEDEGKAYFANKEAIKGAIKKAEGQDIVWQDENCADLQSLLYDDPVKEHKGKIGIIVPASLFLESFGMKEAVEKLGDKFCVWVIAKDEAEKTALQELGIKNAKIKVISKVPERGHQAEVAVMIEAIDQMQKQEGVNLENIGYAFPAIEDSNKDKIVSELNDIFKYLKVPVVVPTLAGKSGEAISTHKIIFELVNAITRTDRKDLKSLVIVLPPIKTPSVEFERILDEYRQTMASRVSA